MLLVARACVTTGLMVASVACSHPSTSSSASPAPTPGRFTRIDRQRVELQQQLARGPAIDCGVAATGADTGAIDSCLLSAHERKRPAFDWLWLSRNEHIKGIGMTTSGHRSIEMTTFDSEDCTGGPGNVATPHSPGTLLTPDPSPDRSNCGGFTTWMCIRLSIALVSRHRALVCSDPPTW